MTEKTELPIEEAAVRLAKTNALREKGIDPYPAKLHRTHTIHAVLGQFEALVEAKKEVTICGRIKTRRGHGAMTFLDLEDGTATIQVAARKNELGDGPYTELTDLIDNADFIEVRGTPFVTKRGEKTVEAVAVRLLSKALLPLPEKWHGLTDVETRYRKRYLDLIANPSVKQNFVKRSAIVRTVREILDRNGFIEVETPVLQPLAGGAAAKPFVTHHNALDIDLYLRIAPELYLKRLIVGGYEKVYEVARCFRNEGLSFQHNPEFTQVEFYWAYASFEELMELMQTMLSELVAVVTGGKQEIERDGVVLNFSGPIPVESFFDLVKKNTGIDLDEVRTEEALINAIRERKLAVSTDAHVGYAELVDALYKETVRAHLIQPTFVIDYPAEMKPLAKRKPGEPNKASAVQLVIQGMELINAYYHEQNDPIEQEERFREEQKVGERGAESAMPSDAEFIEALKHGMPPCAGFGMGIDRLCTVLLGAHSIKEVILFPTLRPE